jgi:phosphoglycolate phosphatase
VVLAEQGLAPVPLAAARSMVGRGAKALIERGFKDAGATPDPARMDALFDRFIAVYLARIAEESLIFEGLEAALDLLAAEGALLAVCTNKRTDLSLALLGGLGLTGRFAAIVGPDQAPAAKPDPSHLLAAVAAAGGHPARALMVGDSITDVQAARAAGVPIVLVGFGYTETPAHELDSDAVIGHFAELPAIARRLLARP